MFLTYNHNYRVPPVAVNSTVHVYIGISVSTYVRALLLSLNRDSCWGKKEEKKVFLLFSLGTLGDESGPTWVIKNADPWRNMITINHSSCFVRTFSNSVFVWDFNYLGVIFLLFVCVFLSCEE